jgi:hypothetical protein
MNISDPTDFVRDFRNPYVRCPLIRGSTVNILGTRLICVVLTFIFLSTVFICLFTLFIFMVYLSSLSVSLATQPRTIVNNELERMWKCSWPIPALVWIEEKITKILIHNIRRRF